MRQMGVRERRDRERLSMRRAILDAARQIAAQEGWQAVTIRRVAEKIEYSPPTIYEYFESKEAILEEEVRAGFSLLLDDLKAARAAHSAPEEQCTAMGYAYWDWVWKYPELYQVISGLGGVNFCESDKPHDQGQEVAGLFSGVLQSILPPGTQTAQDLEDKVVVLWSLIHGFIALIMAGRIPETKRDRARELALLAAGDLLKAWRSP